MNAYDTSSIAMSARRNASGPASPTMPAMIAGRNVTPAVGAWIPTALAVAPIKRTLFARSVAGPGIAGQRSEPSGRGGLSDPRRDGYARDGPAPLDRDRPPPASSAGCRPASAG